MENRSVYLIGIVRQGLVVSPVKIGVAHSPEKRLYALQIANHEKLVLACAFELSSSECFDLETKFRWVYKQRRVRGEWFDVRPPEAVNWLALQTMTMGCAPVCEKIFRKIGWPPFREIAA